MLGVELNIETTTKESKMKVKNTIKPVNIWEIWKGLDIDTDKLLHDCRRWLIECYPADEDDILYCDSKDILQVIEREFSGGIKEFIKAGN